MSTTSMGGIPVVHLTKYLAVARASLLNSTAYASDVLGRTLFLAMVLFIFAQLWQRILPSNATMVGFSASQMVWYMLATEAITLSRPRFEGAITEDVKNGTIAYQLIRPYAYVSYYLSTAMGEFAGRWGINFIIGAGLAFLLVGAPTTRVALLPVMLVTVVFGGLISFLVAMILALSAFWFEENQPFFWIYSKFIFTLGGLFVPVEVYPGFLQRISKALPFEYMVAGPARVFVRFEWSFFYRLFIGQVVWILLLTAIASCIYMAGVKRVHVQGG